MLFKDVALFITYMPYSRMDRSENYSPLTLKYVIKFINSLNFMQTVVVEPHSDVTSALINNCTPRYINFELIEKVKEMVGFDGDKDFLAFPDAGSDKRYSKMKARNILIGHKHRDFETGKILGLDLVGNTLYTYDRKAIIVDDLSSYGGTFVHMSKRLRGEGIKEVYLLVAHAENSVFKGKFKDNPDDENETEKTLFDYVDRVFTTDSLLTEHNHPQNCKFHNPLHVFNIEGVLSND
jgi:ribose-phosphate pyrophosphokinase